MVSFKLGFSKNIKLDLPIISSKNIVNILINAILKTASNFVYTYYTGQTLQAAYFNIDLLGLNNIKLVKKKLV